MTWLWRTAFVDPGAEAGHEPLVGLQPVRKVGELGAELGAGLRGVSAVDETVITAAPPSAFSRCITAGRGAGFGTGGHACVGSAALGVLKDASKWPRQAPETALCIQGAAVGDKQ